MRQQARPSGLAWENRLLPTRGQGLRQPPVSRRARYWSTHRHQVTEKEYSENLPAFHKRIAAPHRYLPVQLALHCPVGLLVGPLRRWQQQRSSH